MKELKDTYQKQKHPWTLQKIICKNFLDDIKINDEVSDFLLDLVADKDIPEEIRFKADELWKKI